MKFLALSILLSTMVSCSKMKKGDELSLFDIPAQKCVKVVISEDVTDEVIKAGSAGTVYYKPEGANMKTSDYAQFKRMVDKCKGN